MFGFIANRLKKRFSKDRKYYTLLDEIFGLRPNNIELYKLALVHRSASIFLSDGSSVNNERLEFLGDAVLESIVSDFLFIEFMDKDEGFLTQIRSRIVSRDTLNEIGLSIGLDKHLVVQYSNRHLQKHLYGDALEAMIGAIYLDKGYDYTNRLVINRILKKNIDLRKMMEVETDFKSRLIEWGHKFKKDVSFDTVMSENSNEHNPHFICVISINGIPAGHGEGSSKKKAEQIASNEALEFTKTINVPSNRSNKPN